MGSIVPRCVQRSADSKGSGHRATIQVHRATIGSFQR
ncbi:hypothetical protein A2U01_0011418, partial [Trifolium medium]|nr:hypothetical protein [Trifolium medium]